MKNLDFRNFLKIVGAFSLFLALIIFIFSACATVDLGNSAITASQQTQEIQSGSDLNFIHHFGLPEALVPIGAPPTDAEKQALFTALHRFSARQKTRSRR